MEGKSSTHMAVFYTLCLPIAFTLIDFGQFCTRLAKLFQGPKMFVWTQKMQSWQPYWKILRQKSKDLLPRRPKMIKKWKFFTKKTFFLKTFQWTRRMLLWQPCHTLFASSRKIFHSKSGKDETVVIFQIRSFFQRSLAKWKSPMSNVYEVEKLFIIIL